MGDPVFTSHNSFYISSTVNSLNMKHLLCIAAVVALASASAIPRDQRPAFCDLGKAWGGATACHNVEPTYTYDATTNACVEIPRGGCLASHNIFKTNEECMSVCGISELAVMLKNGDVKFDLFKFNSLVDRALRGISEAMRWAGADPIDLEGFVLDQIPNFKIGFRNFQLHGLSNLVRVGDWGFDVQGITRYAIHGGVGIHNVSSAITTIGEIAGHGGELTFKTFTNKMDVTFSFYADLALCTIGVDKFTLGDDMHIDIEVLGADGMPDIVSQAIESTTNHLINTFNEYVEKATLVALGAINVCALVAGFVG